MDNPTDATMQDIIREFGADVAELVYRLTDAEEGNRESRTLMSSWRLARAPMSVRSRTAWYTGRIVPPGCSPNPLGA